jgi:hypothetical protein
MTPQVDILTSADVAAIAAEADAALRNVAITQGYHQLAVATRARIGPAANWCAFATWASRQAGRTIRREDLRRALLTRIERLPELRPLITAVVAAAPRTGAGNSAGSVLRAVADAVEYDGGLDRAVTAIGDGNRKVFAEIGAAFARFLEASVALERGAVDAFLDSLAPGPPPDGQDMLRQAFAAYAAGAAAAEDERAQLFHYANLLIACHEQVRLQPEISAAMNAAIDVDAVRDRLITALLPSLWRRIRHRLASLLGRRPPLDTAVERLLLAVQRVLREVITEHAMTLELPDGSVVAMGRDLALSHSPLLARITNADLDALIRRLDPTPDTTRGSGARDWGVLEQRLHFVAELFRCHYSTELLFHTPFTDAQLASLRSGRMPGPPL